MNLKGSLKSIVEKIRSIYPNRMEPLTFSDFLKLLFIDFGLLFVIVLVISLIYIVPGMMSPHQVIRKMSYFVFSAVNIGSVYHASMLELFLIVMVRVFPKYKYSRIVSTKSFRERLSSAVVPFLLFLCLIGFGFLVANLINSKAEEIRKRIPIGCLVGCTNP
jgi:hypothetical protein